MYTRLNLLGEAVLLSKIIKKIQNFSGEIGYVFVMSSLVYTCEAWWKKVQVGNDQEKAQSEKDSHSKNRGGKKPN